MSVNVETAVTPSNNSSTGTAVAAPAAATHNPKDVLDEYKSSKRSIFQAFNPGYVVAGIATLWKSYSSINKSFFSIAKENNRFKEGEKFKQKAVEDAYKRDDMSDPWQKKMEAAGKIERQKPGTIQKVYNEWVKDELRHDGITQPWHKWVRLKLHHKQDVILNVVTVSSIALGAIYSFNRETKLANKLHRQIAKHAQDQDQHQQSL